MDYDIIAKINNQKVLYFERFGSYQGDWFMVTYDNERIYLYRDYYGSCSGCDALESDCRYSETEEEFLSRKGEEYKKNYPPFLTATRESMVVIIENGDLKSILPINRYSDLNREEITKAIKPLLCELLKVSATC